MKNTKHRQKNGVFGIIYLVLIFVFLFAPIAVLIYFSFNSGKSTAVMDGFSLRWYRELFRDEMTLGALKNTVVLAITSTVISTILGTAAAYGISRMKNRYIKSLVMNATNIPLMNPDIITGISLMLLFVFAGTLIGLDPILSFRTLLIAHITFSLPYVVLSVLPKFRQMDRSLPEAALDLGCTPVQSFFKVELPEILPGIFTGAIMAFTLSLDDFVISYFTKGSDFQTLPILIYSMTKKTVTPKIYALATIIFFTILLLLILSNFISTKDERKHINRLKKQRKTKKRR